MNDIFIVSYDDSKLGDYFSLCNNDIREFLQSKHPSVNIHNFHNKTTNLLHDKLSSHNDDYMVAIYAHGDNNKVVDQNGDDLINMKDAESSYHNAIVYSTSCNTANELGNKMHNYGCKFFFGYAKESKVFSSHKDLFIKMDNYGIKYMYLNDCIDGKTIFNAIDKFFAKCLDEIRVENPLLAPTIMHNKESFVIYYNRTKYPY